MSNNELVDRLEKASWPDQNGCRLPTAKLTQEAAAYIVSQSAEIARLKGCLTNIKEIYEIRADIFTNDADLAGSLYDRARAALERWGLK